MTAIKVLGMSGSLRRGSFNTALLQAAVGLAPDGLGIDIFDRVHELPLFNEDTREHGLPAPVDDLCQRIRDADAILIASPEYNHSIPGCLKNAFDWASRPPHVPLMNKAWAIMGASTGHMGTVRAQAHLRDIIMFFNGVVLNKPEIFVGAAHTKFDSDGKLFDEPTIGILRTMLTAFRDRTIALKRSGLFH